MTSDVVLTDQLALNKLVWCVLNPSSIHKQTLFSHILKKNHSSPVLWDSCNHGIPTNGPVFELVILNFLRWCHPGYIEISQMYFAIINIIFVLNL